MAAKLYSLSVTVIIYMDFFHFIFMNYEVTKYPLLQKLRSAHVYTVNLIERKIKKKQNKKKNCPKIMNISHCVLLNIHSVKEQKDIHNRFSLKN